MTALRLLLLVACLALPASASAASTVSFEGGVLVEGDAGPNVVAISIEDDVATVYDESGVTPGTACTAVDARTAVCAVQARVCSYVPDPGQRCNSFTSGRQVLVALGDGDDVLAVAGTYRVTAGGGTGNDRISGAAARDRLQGGDGDDVLRGGTGNDVLDGEAGRDEAYGEAGNDYLHARTDDAVVDGGEGNDGVEIYYEGTADVPVACGAGKDQVWFGYRRGPGMLLDDCEHTYAGNPSPVATTAKGMTFKVRCSLDNNRCKAVLECASPAR